MGNDASDADAHPRYDRTVERIALVLGMPVASFYETTSGATPLSVLAAAIRLNPPGLVALIEAYLRVEDLAERERCVAFTRYLADQGSR